MIHRHDELARTAAQKHAGKVIKTIGDSAMAEFPDPSSAVRAAVEIERQFLKLNSTLPQSERVEVRIGIHSGVGFRKGSDLFGDVVNVAARIVKRTAPAQILISRPVYEAASKESICAANGSASSRSMAARKRKTYLKSPGPTPKPIAKCVSGWQALRASRRATKSCHNLAPAEWA